MPGVGFRFPQTLLWRSGVKTRRTRRPRPPPAREPPPPGSGPSRRRAWSKPHLLKRPARRPQQCRLDLLQVDREAQRRQGEELAPGAQASDSTSMDLETT
ncbi:unnamed protein product [Urochloa humidicola]